MSRYDDWKYEGVAKILLSQYYHKPGSHWSDIVEMFSKYANITESVAHTYLEALDCGI